MSSKVQSGREDTIRNAIERKIKIEGLEEHIGRILIPSEKGDRAAQRQNASSRRKKKFPGYLMCEVEFNDKVLYLFPRKRPAWAIFVGGSLHKLPHGR